MFSLNPLGSFTFHIHLDLILAFTEYKQVVYGMKHTLTMTRSSDVEALFRTGTHDGKVHITAHGLARPHDRVT